METGTLPLEKQGNGFTYPDIAKVLLAAGLGAFLLRGGVGLTRLLGRRAVRPIREEPEEPEEDLRNLKLAKTLDPLPASILGLLAGTGGAYGGWRLADYMFDRRRVQELEEDIDRAKKEYESLLGGPSIEIRIPKTAACMETFMDLSESCKEAGVKISEISIKKALPYVIWTALASLLAHEAIKSYKAARGASGIEQRLRTFQARLRQPVAPAEAVFRPQLTALPSYRRPLALEEEEREPDPLRGM